jgi:hypothetical protein
MSQVSPEPLAHDAFCPHCGYNLRGLSILRCPECGKESERGRLQPSPIPWLYRKQAGRVAAFFRTLWLSTFHPLELTGYLDQEIAGSDARRFRWVCTALLAIPLAVAWGMLPRWATPVGPWGKWLIGGWVNGLFNSNSWGLHLFYLPYQAYELWPFRVLVGLAMASCIGAFPVRLAAFLPFSSPREAVIARANYLVGSLVGGLLAGLLVGLFLAGLFLLTSTLVDTTTSSWPMFFFAIGVVAPGIGLLSFVLACFGYFRRAVIICQTSRGLLLALTPLLIGLWVVFWLMLLPLCVGLFILFYRSLA